MFSQNSSTIYYNMATSLKVLDCSWALSIGVPFTTSETINWVSGENYTKIKKETLKEPTKNTEKICLCYGIL